MYSSAGKFLMQWDIEKGGVGDPTKKSNDVLHVLPVAQRSMLILEVNVLIHRQRLELSSLTDVSLLTPQVKHLEKQIQIYDPRVSLKAKLASFGYQCGSTNLREADATDSETRFVHGSIDQSGNYYARGYMDGVVKLWDIRNVKVRPNRNILLLRRV